MPQNKMMLGALLIVALLFLSMTVFTVHQTEKALMLRFGKVVSADYEPGLHFKIPFIHTVRKFDGRLQSVDSTPEQFLTAEKKNVMVDSFIKWRIKDVVPYFTATGGDERRAGQRLTEIITDGLRSEFGKRTIQEVVVSDRSAIMRSITEESKRRLAEFGLEITDVRIKRIELPKEVSSSVFRRMEAERERVARELRSRGEAAAVRIQAEADRENVELIAKAERDAEQIRGEGDGIASEIYALAYSRNPEFYALYRSLNAYKATFNSRSDILVVEPNSDFFNYFNSLSGRAGAAMPNLIQPQASTAPTNPAPLSLPPPPLPMPRVQDITATPTTAQ